MQIEVKKIYEMKWATEEKTYVILIADTNTGDGEEIATPYSEESIIWDAVRAFPVDQIGEYVAPPEEVQDVQLTQIVPVGQIAQNVVTPEGVQDVAFVEETPSNN